MAGELFATAFVALLNLPTPRNLCGSSVHLEGRDGCIPIYVSVIDARRASPVTHEVSIGVIEGKLFHFGDLSVDCALSILMTDMRRYSFGVWPKPCGLGVLP